MALPIVRYRKWIRKPCCLSEASFKAFPFFVLHNWEPEGQRLCGRLFRVPFFGDAKKVTSCRATPDLLHVKYSQMQFTKLLQTTSACAQKNVHTLRKSKQTKTQSTFQPLCVSTNIQTKSKKPYPTQTRAFLNIRIQGESSPHDSGAHECTAVRNTRSACGIITVKRPSSFVTEVMPSGEPFGLYG